MDGTLKNQAGVAPILREIVMPAQADSEATDVAGVLVDFNKLLKKLRDAGLMEK
jgi:hypothetical protein